MERTPSYAWDSHRFRSSADAAPNMGDEDLRQPYMGTMIMDMKQPLHEAVPFPPELAGRRRVGVFDRDGDFQETFYAPVEAYEGRHRYDPSFEWEPREERRLVRKVSTIEPVTSF